MITAVLSLISFCVLVAEFWSGIAMIGWTGDNMVLERAVSAGPYWFVMTGHTIVGIALPVLSAFAG